jgi:hypothetical protein
MIRRDALTKTRMLQIIPSTDQVLSAELSLLGPFRHIPRCLAHRRRELGSVDMKIKRYHPNRVNDLKLSVSRESSLYRELLSTAPLSFIQRLYCEWSIARFALIRSRRSMFERAREAIRHIPGYSILRSAKRALSRA